MYTVSFHWENYSEAMTTVPFDKYVWNSVTYVGFTTIGTVLSATVVAYGFARFRAKGLGVLFLLLLSSHSPVRDNQGNDIRPSQEEAPRWRFQIFEDGQAMYRAP